MWRIGGRLAHVHLIEHVHVVGAPDARRLFGIDIESITIPRDQTRGQRAVVVNPTTITRIRSGSVSRAALRHALEREIARYARARLREDGISVPLDDLSAIRTYARFREGRLPA
jgi:hypothetical protein